MWKPYNKMKYYICVVSFHASMAASHMSGIDSILKEIQMNTTVQRWLKMPDMFKIKNFLAKSNKAVNWRIQPIPTQYVLCPISSGLPVIHYIWDNLMLKKNYALKNIALPKYYTLVVGGYVHPNQLRATLKKRKKKNHSVLLECKVTETEMIQYDFATVIGFTEWHFCEKFPNYEAINRLNKHAEEIWSGSSICYQQGIILVPYIFFTSHYI